MKIKHLALTVLAALAAQVTILADDTNTTANTPTTTATAPAPAVTPAGTNAATTPALNAAAKAAGASAAPSAADVTVMSSGDDITPTNEVRMNFVDAPLSVVMNYLSKRMGFVMAADVKIHGTATIISEQPVNKDEVYSLLAGALAKNGYSVVRNGRLLAITSQESAQTGSQTPVVDAHNYPASIPESDEMATVILPVQTLNPVQLIKDLDQLIPSGAKVTANEAGNAVIMTGRQKDIHRFSEIISALDSSSVSQVEVFILTNADAKSVASELKEVFQSPDSQVARSDARQRFRGGFFGGGGPFGGGGGGNDNSSESKNAADKAVFVSDDQMNAVVASAPPSFFPSITNIIRQLDQPSEDITEIQTFHLRYADAQETADELSNLFPDDTKTSNDQNNGRGYGFRFFGGGGPFGGGGGGGSATSDRMKRQNSVHAVPDPRTHSLTVTASKSQLVLISKWIEDLDANMAMVQHVYSIDISSADPVTVQALMTQLFAGQNTKSPQSTETSALQQRATTAAQQTTTQSSGFGSLGGAGSSALH